MDFTFHGDTLQGFEHSYNSATFNERAVELAIATRWLDGVKGAGLEVGNVLGWYGLGPERRIVDLHEKGDGVDNTDVFDITGKFKWIISISTIEHVGFDTEPRDLDAAQRALKHLRSLLAPKGQMLITVPAGYHPTFDAYLKTGAGATRDCTMVRDKTGGWKQSKARTFKPYGASTPWAESIWVGQWGGG